jgi:hypothetical protein
MELNAESLKKFLVDAWFEVPVRQIYSVPKQSKDHRILGDIFEAESLKDCFSKYSWGGKDYLQNLKDLESCREALLHSLDSANSESAKSAAYAIYEWGNVKYQANASGAWFEKNHDCGQLLGKLSDSFQILTSGDNLHRFDGVDLIMNSGFTKVASLLSSESNALIIMDGRVGAALGDLVVIAAETGGFTRVGESLLFPWGAARPKKHNQNNVRSRDPSTKSIKFPRLFGANKDYKHADAMFRSSMLIREVVQALQLKGANVSSREYEAALFMWGYDVQSRRPGKSRYSS